MTYPSHSRLNLIRRHMLLASFLCVGGLKSGVAASDDASSFARNFDGMRLVDQDRHPFSFGALKGKVLLVNFVYTGCSAVCPVQTHALVEVQHSLPPKSRNGIQFVSVSLDPRSDTPAVLKAFALRMGADLSRWSFVTGASSDVDRLADRLRLFRPNTKRPDDHSTSIWLVDSRGRLIQRLAGSPPDQARLVRELNSLRDMSTK